MSGNSQTTFSAMKPIQYGNRCVVCLIDLPYPGGQSVHVIDPTSAGALQVCGPQIRSILALRISMLFRFQQRLKKALWLLTINAPPKQMA
jgi:hypothetical protein